MLTGALLLAGLRSGLLTSPVAQGLAIGWLAWWMFGRSGKTEKSPTSQNRQPAAAARGGGGGLDSTLIVPQQLSGTAGTTAAPDARAQQSAQARPVAPRQYRPTEFTPETIRTFTFSQRLVNATTSMSLGAGDGRVCDGCRVLGD